MPTTVLFIYYYFYYSFFNAYFFFHTYIKEGFERKTSYARVMSCSFIHIRERDSNVRNLVRMLCHGTVNYVEGLHHLASLQLPSERR